MVTCPSSFCHPRPGAREKRAAPKCETMRSWDTEDKRNLPTTILEKPGTPAEKTRIEVPRRMATGAGATASATLARPIRTASSFRVATPRSDRAARNPIVGTGARATTVARTAAAVYTTPVATRRIGEMRENWGVFPGPPRPCFSRGGGVGILTATNCWSF